MHGCVYLSSVKTGCLQHHHMPTSQDDNEAGGDKMAHKVGPGAWLRFKMLRQAMAQAVSRSSTWRRRLSTCSGSGFSSAGQVGVPTNEEHRTIFPHSLHLRLRSVQSQNRRRVLVHAVAAMLIVHIIPIPSFSCSLSPSPVPISISKSPCPLASPRPTAKLRPCSIPTPPRCHCSRDPSHTASPREKVLARDHASFFAHTTHTSTANTHHV